MIFNLTIENVDEIVELQLKNSFCDGWNKQMLIDAFRSGNYFCFGIKADGRLNAFIGISLTVDTSDLEDVLVDKDSRRLGLAEKLIIHALNFIKGLNKQKMFLEVRESNLPAITLYEKLGFIRLGVIPKGFRLDSGEYADIIPHYISL